MSPGPIRFGHQATVSSADGPGSRLRGRSTCRPEHACMSSEHTARVAMASIFKVALYKYLSSARSPSDRRMSVCQYHETDSSADKTLKELSQSQPPTGKPGADAMQRWVLSLACCRWLGGLR